MKTNMIGWGWALVVLGYSLAWFLINDGVKRAACGVSGRSESGSIPKRLQLQRQLSAS